MEFDLSSRLWSGSPATPFFQDRTLHHRRQVGGSCVSTGLSLLTGDLPADIRTRINTQDPVSWSRYLTGHGLKLAYCPSDFRRLRHYVDDLLRLDDLFTLSTYSPSHPLDIGADPDEDGWVCSSHFVVLHRDTMYDTRFEAPVRLRDYADRDSYIKRIFRVVPATHERGI